MNRYLVVLLVSLTVALLPAPPAQALAVPVAPDVGFVDQDTGVWDLGRGDPFYYGVPGDVPFLGDWNGDGVETPGLYRASTGFAYVRDSNDFGPGSWGSRVISHWSETGTVMASTRSACTEMEPCFSGA